MFSKRRRQRSNNQCHCRTVEIDFDYCIVETDGAVLIDFEGREVWIPRSCIVGDVPRGNEENGSIELPEYFAIEKGLV